MKYHRSLIRELRKERGITQDQLSAKSSVSQRTIYAMEVGRKTQVYNRRKVLEALDLDYFKDRSWVFPGYNVGVLIVQMDSDKAAKILSSNDSDELAYYGKKILNGIMEDGRGSRALELTNESVQSDI